MLMLSDYHRTKNYGKPPDIEQWFASQGAWQTAGLANRRGLLEQTIPLQEFHWSIRIYGKGRLGGRKNESSPWLVQQLQQSENIPIYSLRRRNNGEGYWISLSYREACRSEYSVIITLQNRIWSKCPSDWEFWKTLFGRGNLLNCHSHEGECWKNQETRKMIFTFSCFAGRRCPDLSGRIRA